jgi:hypothetical protein
MNSLQRDLIRALLKELRAAGLRPYWMRVDTLSISAASGTVEDWPPYRTWCRPLTVTEVLNILEQPGHSLYVLYFVAREDDSYHAVRVVPSGTPSNFLAECHISHPRFGRVLADLKAQAEALGSWERAV